MVFTPDACPQPDKGCQVFPEAMFKRNSGVRGLPESGRCKISSEQCSNKNAERPTPTAAAPKLKNLKDF